MNRIADVLPQGEKGECADNQGARRHGQRQREAVLLQCRAILLDAVDAIEAALELPEECAAGYQRADEPHDQAGITV